MPLTPGSRLGSYEVTAQIGVGGMGEVYRATDTNLKRVVAIKVLPEALAHDQERLARFQREAEVLASLNHPHIAQIHGLEKSDGITGLVMEFVEGPTLADRIADGAVPVEEALTIARQIAEGLEAAHERAIIHRDLKPANIKVRPDGTVKVLDFGLAKGLGPDNGQQAEGRRQGGTPSMMPTITTPAMMTGAGVILGTAAYMSPEQARGKPADKRADIWAFGCVLFEMMAGVRPFSGDEVPDVLAAVLSKDPDWNALPADVPPIVCRLLGRCLTKDARQRLHDIADARLDLQDAIAGPRHDGASQPSRTAPRPSRWLAPSIAGAIALAVGVGGGAAFWRQPAAASPVTRAMLDVAPADELGTTSVLNMLPAGGRSAIAWSPSGRTLAFIGSQRGTRQIFLRDLASGEAKPLDGTQNALAMTYSPNGEWIAFWTGAEIRKVSVTGSPPARICAAIQVSGLTWGNTRLVFTTRYQVFEVSSDGGEPRALTEANMRRSAPSFLPGDKALLYTEYGKVFTSGDERVMIRRLSGDAEPTVLVPEAADARYLPTGHLAFLRQGTLFVVPFNVEALEVRGSPVAVLSGVAQSVAAWFSDDLTVSGQLAISPQGTLAYVSSQSISFPMSDLVRVNRKGEVTLLGAPTNTYRERVEVSPDGSTLAVSIQSTTDVRFFLYDLLRGTLAPAFPQQSNREAIRPIWSPDGRIAIQIYQEGGSQLAVVSRDRATVVEDYPSPRGGFAPSSWSPNGEELLGTIFDDLWKYTPAGQGEKATAMTTSPALEGYPSLSPDGKWLAYVSTVSGRNEVYVQAYPGPGQPILVSTAGGISPAWNRVRPELIYTEPVTDAGAQPGDVWRVMSVQMRNALIPGRPEFLFEVSNSNLPMVQCARTNCFSVAPDGQSFYTLQLRPRQTPRVTSINLILNWFEEVRRLAPVN